MDNTVGQLFISYSHTDDAFMVSFRKHLQGMLLNRIQVWSDHEISKGAEWESFLKGNLNQASSALILATPDYLVSPWCRAELKELVAAQNAGRLRNLFWVQLRPCGWQHTELAAFQCVESSLNFSIAESPDEMQRQRAILQACERIASQILSSITERDNHLGFVRRLLLDVPPGCDITVNSVLDVGAFSIVCQGRCGSIDAAIKVLRRSPLQKVTEDFLRIGNQRKEVEDPSFVRIQNMFEVGAEEERRIIIVSEFVSDRRRKLSTILKDGKPMSIDKAALLLRRMAEGLTALHKAGEQAQAAAKDRDKEWEWTLGLLTPDNIFYDQSGERFRIAPIGISSFLWHVLDWATYRDWVDPGATVYVSPEQWDKPREHLTFKTDQYMLGRLGVELLEGLEFDAILKRKSATPEEFWRNPASFIEKPWINNHRQLWNILETLLKPDPEERFKTMEEVVHELLGLEEQDRALAKRVYCPDLETKGQNTVQLKNNEEFFRQFYENFFSASPESRAKFKDIALESQHRNLMQSMVAVLNFRKGNTPTSLDDISEKHQKRGITEREFEKFRESFIATLAKFTNGDQETIKAWDGLLRPVIDYMVSKCTTPPVSGPVIEERTTTGSDSSAQSGLQEQPHMEAR